MRAIRIEELGWKPPTITAQQKGVRTFRGKPMFYTKPEIIAARNELLFYIKRYAPDALMSGAIRMTVEWTFYKKTAKKQRTPKTTRPDGDNLQKLLQDTMNGLFYFDDSQIYDLSIKKFESSDEDVCGLSIILIEEDREMTEEDWGRIEDMETATKIIEEVREEMCNKYCKYTSERMVVDTDMEFDKFCETYCEDCPLNRL